MSTPSPLCAQIVAPYPPPGRIGVASQSGNFVSSFLNYAVQTGIGISRVGVGGERGRGHRARLPRLLRRRPRDRGRARLRRGHPRRARASSTASARSRRASRSCCSRAARPRAASAPRRRTPVRSPATTGSSTACAARRASRARDTSKRRSRRRRRSRPSRSRAGPRVAVVTTAGGLGRRDRRRDHPVAELELVELPDDLRAAIDEKLPPRWSRNNPIDLAGGETRDTIPEVLELVAGTTRRRRDRLPRARHPVEPGPADARRAASTRVTGSNGSSRTTSARTSASPAPRPRSRTRPASRSSPRPSSRSRRPTTPGRAPCARPGGSATPSSNRAVTALEHLWRYAQWRDRRAERTGSETRAAGERHEPQRRRLIVAGVLGVVGVVAIVVGLQGPASPRRARARSASRDPGVVGASGTRTDLGQRRHRAAAGARWTAEPREPSRATSCPVPTV